MKNTRKIFRFRGNPQIISTVLNQLDFKGTTRFYESVTVEQIQTVFNNNKSVICSSIPPEFESRAINIVVGAKNESNLDLSSYFIDIDDDIISQFEKIADISNVDIGDHRRNSSGLTGAPSIESCAYCKCIRDDYYDCEHQISRIIYRSENFFVMPTLGQFMTGYLLIIPVQHIMSNANLVPALQKEFSLVLDDIQLILELTYNTSQFLVWENGTGNQGKGKAKDSIVHSHVHIAPSNITAKKVQEISNFAFSHIRTEELERYKNDSYLLIQDADDSWYINNDSELYIPRQYIRQLLANEHGLSGDSWNWRTYPFPELMAQTVKEIEFALRSNYDKLPERIKKNCCLI